ncbi:MAG: hypothetical protein AAFR12_04090 [Cyanobacteria bacterium J06626_6]
MKMNYFALLTCIVITGFSSITLLCVLNKYDFESSIETRFVILKIKGSPARIELEKVLEQEAIDPEAIDPEAIDQEVIEQ